MPARVRFGLIGCGVIGPHHAWAISQLPDAELVAVCDAVPDRAHRLAQEYGAHRHEHLIDLLRRPDIDAVTICTPSGLHADHAVAALEAGKHVMIEKPVDITPGAINRIIEARNKAKRKVGVIFQHRWDLASRVVKDAVEVGRFGRLTTGAAQLRWWRSQAYYDSGDWRGTWALDGGGALMNQGVHTVDLLQWILGPVAEVYAYTGLQAHERIEVEDTAVAAVRFANGALGVLQATTAAYPGLTARLEVHGNSGSAIIDNNLLTYFHAADTAAGAGSERGVSSAGNQAEAMVNRYLAAMKDPAAATSYPQLSVAHQENIGDLVAAIRDDRDPLVTPEEGRKAVEIILAVYESARSGRPVRVVCQA